MIPNTIASRCILVFSAGQVLINIGVPVVTALRITSIPFNTTYRLRGINVSDDVEEVVVENVDANRIIAKAI